MKEPRQLKSSEIAKFREYMIKKQNGICPICKKPITDPVLDHSHQKKVKGTGLCRGVVHRTCNVFLAKSENNAIRYRISQKELPSILRNIADYLDKPHLPFIHPNEKPKALKLMRSSYNKLKSVYRGRKPIPDFRVDDKGRPNQKMTIPLQKLFDEYGIEPEYYGK